MLDATHSSVSARGSEKHGGPLHDSRYLCFYKHKSTSNGHFCAGSFTFNHRWGQGQIAANGLGPRHNGATARSCRAHEQMSVKT